MKKIYLKFLLVIALYTVLTGCTDKDFDNRTIQAGDSHGEDQNMISTAVTASSTSEFYANAVDASVDEAEITLIPVVLTAKGTASQNIKVKFVPAPEELASFNSLNFDEFDEETGELIQAHPEDYYVMPGDVGTPAFTLVDDGIVTIPKGSSTGFVKIKTTTADYFGDTKYAYSYKIESVEQSGYSISGNHYFGIVAVIPKNPYDGKYSLNITTSGWSAYGISDNLPGDYGTVALGTTGLTSNIFVNSVAGGNLQAAFSAGNATKTAFGATGPVYVFDPTSNKIVDVFNSVADDGRGRKFNLNPAAVATDNVYDPATKTIVLNYLMHQNGRPDQTIKMILEYVGPR